MLWVIISPSFLPYQTSRILPPSSLSWSPFYFTEKLELIRTFIILTLKPLADPHLHPCAPPLPASVDRAPVLFYEVNPSAYAVGPDSSHILKDTL